MLSCHFAQRYDLSNVPAWTDMHSGLLMIGAGAAPMDVAGALAEVEVTFGHNLNCGKYFCLHHTVLVCRM